VNDGAFFGISFVTVSIGTRQFSFFT
jgi:hypothetical protein